MQAISRMSHEKFCELVKYLKLNKELSDEHFHINERELEIIFTEYQQKLIEIKELIIEYESRKSKLRKIINKYFKSKNRKPRLQSMVIIQSKIANP